MSEPLVLTCAADDDFALPLGTMLHSALTNLRPGGGVHLFVIGDGLKAKNKARLRRTVRAARPDTKLSWLCAADRLPGGLKTSWCISSSAYLRLLLPELLPGRYDKAIYLDADLVVEADLRRLWNEPLDGQAVGAVQDFIVPYVSCEKGLALYRELGLAPEAPYFNSGVLVMNLRRWRGENLGRQVFRYLREHREHVYLHDQDGLNAVLAGMWKKLDLRWNQQTHLFWLRVWSDSPFKSKVRAARKRLTTDPYIVHFTGGAKPWHPRCDHPERGRFLRYLKASAWFTSPEYSVWRAVNLLRRPEHWLREKTRPYRRRLGVLTYGD